MEEYTQITLDQWMQWKEDIRKKLEETAGNFVHIGYRLKQIRDSGMYGGAADIFEFAEKEYGLGKSTVSRFIAINERYSEGGDSLELKEEFRGFSSSKLSEMLTLPDSEIKLITEKTTVREIRELKSFNSRKPDESEPEAGTEHSFGEGYGNRPALEKCLIDFFKTRKETLNDVMKCLDADPAEYKQAAELMAPSGQASHRKGIVFLFMYDWATGIKYKLMTEPEPVSMSWQGLLDIVYGIFENWREEDAVATSQQEEKPGAEQEPEPETIPAEDSENAELVPPEQEKDNAVATSQQNEETGKPGSDEDILDIAPDEPGELQEEPQEEPAGQQAPIKVCSRKQYIDGLTAKQAARYISDKRRYGSISDITLLCPEDLEEWLNTEVDEAGEEV